MPQRTISKSKNRSGTAKAKLKKKITRKKERKEKKEVQYEAAMISLASSLQASGVSRADFRKAQILEAVITISATEGFDAISFDRVGKALGIQKSNVAYYFNSKEEMLEKAMHYALTKGLGHVAEGLAGKKSGQEQLRAYIAAHFGWVQFHFQHAVVILISFTRSSSDPIAKAFSIQTIEGGRKRIKAILQEIARETDSLKDKNLDDLAEFLQDHLLGIFLQLAGLNGAPTDKQIEDKQKHLEKMLSKFLKISF